MSVFRVVLDTCVLVPIVKADLLLTLAARQVFHPLWSSTILSDNFLLDLLDLNPSGMLGCLIELSSKRRNPPITVADLIAALERSAVPAFARELRSILDDS